VLQHASAASDYAVRITLSLELLTRRSFHVAQSYTPMWSRPEWRSATARYRPSSGRNANPARPRQISFQKRVGGTIRLTMWVGQFRVEDVERRCWVGEAVERDAKLPTTHTKIRIDP